MRSLLPFLGPKDDSCSYDRFIHTLFHHSRLPWAFGGEYDQFASLIERTVDAWLSIGIEPAFVFDGEPFPLSGERTNEQIHKYSSEVLPNRSSFPLRSRGKRLRTYTTASSSSAPRPHLETPPGSSPNPASSPRSPMPPAYKPSYASTNAIPPSPSTLPIERLMPLPSPSPVASARM